MDPPSPQQTVQGLGNVLVIGGCGLLGHHIVKFLVENGKPSDGNFVFDLSSVFARCNIVGVQIIANCAQEQGIPVLVHLSSSEEDLVNGSVYAKTKAIEEGLVIPANRQRSLLTTAIRLCTLVREEDRVLTRQFIELGRKGTIKSQVRHGKNMDDFIYAGNAAEGHLIAAQALLHTASSDASIPANKHVDGEAFNMTNDEPWPFWEAARFVSNTTGFPMAEHEVWKIPMELVYFFMAIWEAIYWVFMLGGEPEVKARVLRYTQQVRTFDITKAREGLGFEPRVTLEERFRRGVNWHREQDKQKAKSL
ncbi:putative sterol-4-alpha-carboxylate 3-dehydrogenase, decarboxylating [Paraphaeosphaeria sporulosa]|uniref:Putative sterol-4-alpha-carboxylate 3-dehydrogenase, decarboxylating n=1 Tax=Paraphaeosphaeria sporulosa TaxID=1460663 RepID=A0A177D096_9PLEO|nr:putative sterol-4-alpha-carboxylate 3-dehydrogenase, decarboxylating [Paraphaeosphaeria sporulosa]OAG12861.1 putative sterol-4-alpha-carboxylate 3-dehydrogenase, decarboxylating [Paraphaeosphaeria sporulosa]